MQLQQKITPFLSFENQAEEAAEFYASLLPNSKVMQSMKNPATGTVLTVEFQLAGMNFVAMNVGERWEFTDAISLAVSCESQEEIDRLWSQFTAAGGKEVQCGWLKDRFGVSWQIVPAVMPKLLNSSDPAKSQRVMQAMMQMVKLDIAQLEQAYHGPAHAPSSLA